MDSNIIEHDKLKLFTLENVNSVPMRVEGNISVPGAVDRYPLTVEEPRRLIFDSLTNRSDMVWTLTGWESVSTVGSLGTLLQRSELEGWKLVTGPDDYRGGKNGFKIWGNNDRMKNATGQLKPVHSGANSGRNWLELANAAGTMGQTLGIERHMETQAGVTYQLSLDVAGCLGFSADYTRIGLYVDDIRIGHNESISDNSALNWQPLSLSFVGKGGQQTLRIITEATQFSPEGRGMMVDNIGLAEVLSTNQGIQDTPICLSVIRAVLTDADGSETLCITVEDLPEGSVLSDGVHYFTATHAQHRIDITDWQLAHLTLTPPASFSGQVVLTVVATATEQASQHSASTSATLTIDVRSASGG